MAWCLAAPSPLASLDAFRLEPPPLPLPDGFFPPVLPLLPLAEAFFVAAPPDAAPPVFLSLARLDTGSFSGGGSSLLRSLADPPFGPICSRYKV